MKRWILGLALLFTVGGAHALPPIEINKFRAIAMEALQQKHESGTSMVAVYMHMCPRPRVFNRGYLYVIDFTTRREGHGHIQLRRKNIARFFMYHFGYTPEDMENKIVLVQQIYEHHFRRCPTGA